MDLLRQLLDEVPEDLRQQVFTHASWTDRRSDSYSRLAFLGDSVLGLAITAHLYPRLEAERYGAGRLTKIRAQTVSGPSCRAVAERLGVVPHGRFSRRGIAQAILLAARAVDGDVVGRTHAALEAAHALRPARLSGSPSTVGSP